MLKPGINCGVDNALRVARSKILCEFRGVMLNMAENRGYPYHLSGKWRRGRPYNGLCCLNKSVRVFVWAQRSGTTGECHKESGFLGGKMRGFMAKIEQAGRTYAFNIAPFRGEGQVEV
ncbi:hypothetical protein AA0482_2548 [Acetobacter cibinongensis NRIC 0482]|nr:hypothetical protein AA0482_2548 [Acetobacter cibinongensis NRIC 0482]